MSMSTLPSDDDLRHRAQILDLREQQITNQLENQRASIQMREDRLAQERIDLDIKHQQQIDVIKLKEERQLADLKSRVDLFEIDMRRREDALKMETQQHELNKGLEREKERGDLQKQRQELETQREALLQQQNLLHLLPNSTFLDTLTMGLEPHPAATFQPQLFSPHHRKNGEGGKGEEGHGDGEKLLLLSRQLKMISKQTQNRYDDTLRIRDEIIRRESGIYAVLDELNLVKEQFTLESQRREEEIASKEMELKIRSKMLDAEHKQRLQKLEEEYNLKLKLMDEKVGMKSADLYEFISGNQRRLDVIKVLGMGHNEANNALVNMTDDEFNSSYHPDRLVLYQKYSDNQLLLNSIAGMSDDKFNSEEIQTKLYIVECQSLSNSPPPLPIQTLLFFQSNAEFKSSLLYRTYFPYRGLGENMKANLHGWGTGSSSTFFQFCFPQLKKQCHSWDYTFMPLIDALYPRDGTNERNSFTHPLNSLVSKNEPTVFGYFLKPLYNNGTIPKLTPNLKLFFSTPHIANGDWIQFHGPGTVLWKLIGGAVPTQSHLTLSALCPKGKEGSYKSQDSYYDRTGQLVNAEKTSSYSISIKWEY